VEADRLPMPPLYQCGNHGIIDGGGPNLQQWK